MSIGLGIPTVTKAEAESIARNHARSAVGSLRSGGQGRWRSLRFSSAPPSSAGSRAVAPMPPMVRATAKMTTHEPTIASGPLSWKARFALIVSYSLAIMVSRLTANSSSVSRPL